MTLFCGIDWAETQHDVAIITSEGQLVAKKHITDDPAGFAQLIGMLRGLRQRRCHGSGCDRNAARPAGLRIAGHWTAGVCD